MHEHALDHDVSRAALWVGVLGGALAWLVHFLLAYVIAEWGCVPLVPGVRVLGLTGTIWLLLIVSAVMFAIACASALIARRSRARLPDPGGEGGAEPFMARLGVQLSALFAFIIAVESVPIFYFLSGC